MVKRFEIYMLNTDAAHSDDPKITLPCVVISPDEMNENLPSAIIAPIVSDIVGFPTRVELDFLGKTRSIALDQIKTVESARLFKKIGELQKPLPSTICSVLKELFAE